MPNPPPERHHDDLMEALLESLVGPATSGIRGQIQNNAMSRGNTPSRWHDNLAGGGRSPPPGALWIVDRILEPQTIAHFIQFMVGGRLPGGTQAQLPVLGMDVQFLVQPMSLWAPAPYNRAGRSISHNIMTRIGSLEDGSRLQGVSNNLHSMKSRIWEGISPLSDRRWRDKRLDEPENFSEACQLITEVLMVFLYLNEPQVKTKLRDTYNLIWDQLKVFEDALNAKRVFESKDPVSPTSLWAEYIRCHYAFMETRTHAWLAERLNKMKERVLIDLAQHQPSGLWGSAHDQRQWQLTNMWQDLIENFAHADVAVFISLDGYKGCHSASATGRPAAAREEYHGTTPLFFSPNIYKRQRDYHLRRRQIHFMNEINDAIQNPTVAQEPLNSPSTLVSTCSKQAEAQNQARLELRGSAPTRGQESFVSEAEHKSWGFVAYRTHYGHTDAEWTEFKTKFDADVSNWGRELGGTDSIRARSKIHWLDAKELGLMGDDLESIKRHFGQFKDSTDFPSKFWKDVFLVADEASINSYVKPVPEPPAGLLPPGDLGGFILAVDQNYDASEPREREDESPGYDGTLRVLGSILWDDFSALLVMQTQHLEDLWPLAMDHPLGVYVGHVVKKQLISWRVLRRIGRDFWSFYMNWQDQNREPSQSSS